jgi:GT2 family glycosyltransferase
MLLARRAEFLRLGGFDRRFFLYYEDRDLAARYRQAELPIRITTALEGAHAESGSSGTDDLRVVPAGWAFLGWIQYVFLHRGERAARLTARVGVTTLQTLSLTLAGAAKIAPKRRIERKRTQLDALLKFLDDQAAQPAGEDSFCPDARRLLGMVR